jgi:DNA invertase Pin-like site-specific DNA recombinase
MNNQPKRIAFYIRSATGNLADLKRQYKALSREFVNRRVDFTSSSVELYRDTHQSGLHPGPEFQRLSHDISRGKIDVVMVARMNRISRSLSGLMKFQELVKARNVRFISTEENVDSIYWHASQVAVGGAK